MGSSCDAYPAMLGGLLWALWVLNRDYHLDLITELPEADLASCPAADCSGNRAHVFLARVLFGVVLDDAALTLTLPALVEP